MKSLIYTKSFYLVFNQIKFNNLFNDDKII